ncbi:three-Cys-motif partner protein TcmP, partial [candidate division WOR-3 bacterium]|nr:three-Cys-motif partner protein TcmP [candidate division WOR-3 bacterium]
MSIGKSNDLWNISNKPSTKAKLAILRKVFDMWITIWNKQNWASKEWYVIDLFAGRGNYIDKDKTVSGSPLIFLETISDKKNKLRNNLKIKLFFVEKDKRNFEFLKKTIIKFMENNSQIRDVVEIKCFNADCNKVMKEIGEEIKNTKKHPLFILIDPSGLQIKKTTMEKIVRLNNPKDIIFNYILEGVRRISGIEKKDRRGEDLNIKEIKTLETLREFIGDDVNVTNENGRKVLDRKVLEDYSTLFTSQGLKVVAYDMRYPDRNDILYYLLFASRNLLITDIVKDIYAGQKVKSLGQTLFGGKEYYKGNIITVSPKFRGIRRKTLLYKTEVEYGNWT